MMMVYFEVIFQHLRGGKWEKLNKPLDMRLIWNFRTSRLRGRNAYSPKRVFLNTNSIQINCLFASFLSIL